MNKLDELVSSGELEIVKSQDGHLIVKHLADGKSYVWGGCDEKTGEGVLIEWSGSSEPVENFSSGSGEVSSDKKPEAPGIVKSLSNALDKMLGRPQDAINAQSGVDLSKENQGLVDLVHLRDQQLAELANEVAQKDDVIEKSRQYIEALEKQVNDLEAKIPHEEVSNEIQPS